MYVVVLLLLSLHHVHFVTSTVYTVTLDDHYYPNTTCHHCHNLQHYLLNVTKYFTSNTQLLFLPGLHHLHTELIIQNVHNISLIGSTANGTTLDTVIQCSIYDVAGIMMMGITNLTMKHIMIHDCSTRIVFDKHPFDVLYFSMLIRDCENVYVQHVSIDRTLTGINILGISYLNYVSCNKIVLYYTEIQTHREHQYLFIGYFQIINDFIFENIVEISMSQLSYRVAVQLSNTVVQDVIETFICVKHISYMSLLLIINNQFYHNYNELFVMNSGDNAITVHFVNCKFFRNLPQSLIKTDTVSINISHCFFCENVGVLETNGSTMGLSSVIIQNTTFSFADIEEFSFVDEEHEQLEYQELVQVKDTALFLIGPVTFSHNVGFFNSIISLRGNSTITIDGRVKFSNNIVHKVINFNDNSNQYINVTERTIITINQNQICKLFNIAVFKPIPYPPCIFQYSTASTNLDDNIEKGKFSIILYNNTHNQTEQNCNYEIPISKCFWLPHVQSVIKNRIPLDVNKQYMQYNNYSEIYTLTINQSTLCICTEKRHPDCHITDLGYLYPGQSLSLYLYHNCEQCSKCNAEVIVKIDIDLSYIKPCIVLNINEHQELKSPSCTEVRYEIGFSNYSWCDLLLKLKSDFHDIVNIFYVRKLRCPPGFAELSNVCQCDPVITNYELITCDINDQTILRPANSWVSATTHNNSYTYHISLHCPFHYCLPHSSHLNLSTPNSQCQFNRSGLLCGHCQKGLSTVLGSSQCTPCSNVTAFIIVLVIAVAGLVLVLLLFVLNLTVTDGSINTYIFYANVISINITVFFPNTKTFTPTYTFISLANLDLGIPTCFYNGMDDYAKMWLQLAFPFYLIFIATLIIITSRYSTTIQRLTARRALPVLATLFLLSYTKILRIVSSVLFFYSTITHLPSKHTTLVWSVDANVPLFGVRFTILFIVCLILFLILVPFNVILLFTRTLSRFKFINKFKPLLDAYQGPCKDKFYYWTGLQLLARAVFFGMSSLDKNINITTSAILLGVFGGSSAALSPFKNKYINLQELVFIFNLQGLYIMSLYNQTTDTMNMISINTMIIMAGVHFIFIIAYLVITYASGGVIKYKIQSIVNTFTGWINRLHNKSQHRQFQLDSMCNKIPEVAFNYHEFREPLVGVD